MKERGDAMLYAHPQLVKAKLKKLHPTQITVGLAEVRLKSELWRSLGKRMREDVLQTHWFPSVLGPGGHRYIVDHHHFGLALLEHNVEEVWLAVVKDLSMVDPAKFWFVMDHHQWVHPYNNRGERCSFDALPAHLSQLQDDPYRSLAGEVRRAGGYAKDVTPFNEFLWADFFRDRISIKAIQGDFNKAVSKAVTLAHSADAGYLPGWSGNFNAS